MDEFLKSLSALEWVFFFSALVGTCLFIVRLILMFTIGDQGHDFDTDVGHDFDAHDGSYDDADSDSSFKLLSFQGLMAFFMMFGLVGLGCMRGGVLGAVFSLAFAVASGLAAVWIVSKLFLFMIRMQSSGTLDLYSAVGEEGKVYLTIPPEGSGKVQVIVQERLMVLDAISEENDAIKTGERIRVENLSGQSTLVVKRV